MIKMRLSDIKAKIKAQHQQEEQELKRSRGYMQILGALLPQVILVLLCLVCYVSALNGTFVFDDTVAVAKNPLVTRLPTNLSAIFRNDFWGIPLQNKDSHKSWRPLTTLMLHFEYAYLGFRAKYMKLVNLVLHCVNTLLVRRLLGKIKIESVANELVASIGAALFAVHPVHTEAVCGVVGRAELLFCMIYLVALLVAHSRGKRSAHRTDWTIVGLTALGILCKETAVTIPIACVFLEYMRKEMYTKTIKQQTRLVFSPRNLGYFFTTMSFIIFRFWLQNFESPRFKPEDNPVAFSEDIATRFFSQNFLYAINLWIMLCPQWLSFDWAVGCVELITSHLDLRLQAVLALYTYLIVTFINFRHNLGPIIGLGLIAIPFLPASGIITVGFVIAERVLYVPSIGFCYIVAYSFVQQIFFFRRQWVRIVYKWILMLVLACFLLRTRQRAAEWLSEEQLFSSALKVCPNNAKVHYNIARLASDNQEVEKAFKHYHRAIDLYPQYESALMNLGNMYREKGELEKAEQFIKSALDAYPDFPVAWMNLGIVQSARKKHKEALKSYEKALELRQNYAICHYNLGNLYLDLKQYARAIHHWQKAVALNPRQPKAWTNILTMLDSRDLHEDALRLSAKALEHLPNETSIVFIRANIFGKMKQYVKAEQLFKHVILEEPQNPLFHTNLGVLYHRWERIDDAIDSYQRAMKLGADKSATACENLRKLLKRKKQLEQGVTLEPGDDLEDEDSTAGSDSSLDGHTEIN